MADDESSTGGFWMGLGIFAICGKALFLISKCSSVAKVAVVATAVSHTDEVIDVGRLATRGLGTTDEIAVGARLADDTGEVGSLGRLHSPDYKYKEGNFAVSSKSNKTNSLHSLDDIQEVSINDLNKEEMKYFTKPEIFDVDHFVSIPSNELSYKNIFTIAPRNSEIDRIKNIRNELSIHDNIYIANTDDGPTQVKQFLNETESQYVTFTGHNENGWFRLPSGKKIDINHVAEMCIEFAKKCVFLSCKSKNHIKQFANSNFGVSKDLSYSDARSVIGEINKKSQQSKNGEVSFSEFSLFIAEEIDTALSVVQFKSKAILHVKRGSKVSGIGGVSYKVNAYFSEDNH